MEKAQSQVKDFMVIAGQACPTELTTPDKSTRKLRVKLNLEEVLEFAVASGVDILVEGVSLNKAFESKRVTYNLDGDCDIVGVADALADTQYVNLGAATAFGIDLEPVFEEVHSSNLTKRWDVADLNQYIVIAEDGANLYKGEIVSIDIDGNMPSGTRKYTVRDASGKMIKSPSYRPADLVKVLVEQGLHPTA